MWNSGGPPQHYATKGILIRRGPFTVPGWSPKESELNGESNQKSTSLLETSSEWLSLILPCWTNLKEGIERSSERLTSKIGELEQRQKGLNRPLVLATSQIARHIIRGAQEHIYSCRERAAREMRHKLLPCSYILFIFICLLDDR